QPGVPFVLFNPTAWPRTETVEVELQFEHDDVTANGFHLVDAGDQVVAHQRISESRLFETEVGKNNDLRCVRVAMPLQALPACGYRVYYAQPGPAPSPPAVEHPVRTFGRGLENRYLRVTIETDGTLTLWDKETGCTFEHLGYLVDEEDAGDEYDYAPCPHPERISTWGEPAEVRLLYAGPLQAAYEIVRELALPVSLTADRQRRHDQRVRCPVTTTVTLHRDSRRVDLRTMIENRAQDHCLRVCFPTHIQTDVAHADGHFDVLARPIDRPPGEDWDQPPVPTKHQRYFVDLSDGRGGLAIYNRGLAEYEVLREQAAGVDRGRNTIALTLLRCVGYLSRGEGDMPTRPALAGPPLPTPEAQCLGTHTFEYALVPHPGDWRTIYRDAYTYRAPVYVRRGTEHEGYKPTPSDIETWGTAGLKPLDLNGDLPGELSFLAVQPETVTLSAVKRSERGDALIIRIYNPTSEDVEATIRLSRSLRSVQEVALHEEPLAELVAGADGQITLPLAGKQVKTLAVQIGVTD
ncbi:MAG: glycoside hydrolase family 38 C-terminal domain-containing protein, partial [Anaerolineae bacterium]